MSIEGQRILLEMQSILSRDYTVAAANTGKTAIEFKTLDLVRASKGNSSLLDAINNISVQFNTESVSISKTGNSLGTILINIDTNIDPSVIENSISRLLKDPSFVYSILRENKVFDDIDAQFQRILEGKPEQLVRRANNPADKKSFVRTTKGQFYSLSNLQIILNQRLADQIKSNMGTGSNTNILNYRSGRFANSVIVDKLTLTKEGAITIFYDYMKYPYQTFEPGFVQGLPESRNPRLLIAKSIRQIAEEIVTNKLRSVSV